MLHNAIQIEDEALVAELHRLGVRHLARFSSSDKFDAISPSTLLSALAQHRLARLRTSLVLLFLRQPKFHLHLADVIGQLSPLASDALKLYYQAAVYLQQQFREELELLLEADWQALPDYFSTELQVTVSKPFNIAQALQALAAEHTRRTGYAYNWSGAYQQNIPLLLKHLRYDQRHR
jgi:hypothetical protein